MCGVCGVCACACVYGITHAYKPLLSLVSWVKASSTADPESELCFSHDPRVDLSLSSNCSDYNNTVFVKGQMVPSGECLSYLVHFSEQALVGGL